jgi:hypothetical protein
LLVDGPGLISPFVTRIHVAPSAYAHGPGPLSHLGVGPLDVWGLDTGAHYAALLHPILVRRRRIPQMHHALDHVLVGPVIHLENAVDLLNFVVVMLVNLLKLPHAFGGDTIQICNLCLIK